MRAHAATGFQECAETDRCIVCRRLATRMLPHAAGPWYDRDAWTVMVPCCDEHRPEMLPVED